MRLLRSPARIQAANVSPAAGSQPLSSSSRPNPGRGLGLLVILGGLAAGSYFATGSVRQPQAAFETLKPQVAIVAVSGDVKGVTRSLAAKLGLQYIAPGESMAPFVDKGVSRFIIDGLNDQSKLDRFEKETCEADVVLDFNGKLRASPKVVNVTSPDDVDAALRRLGLIA